MPIEDKFKVALAVHSYGHIDPRAYVNHVGIFARWSKDYNIVFMMLDGVKTAEARNVLVDRAMTENCTHMLFLDADHIVKDDMLPCLLGNKAAVVSGLAVRRNGDGSQVGFIVTPNDDYYALELPTDGLSYAVDACAFGCTLIDMKVFKAIEKPYFKDVMFRKKDGELAQRRSDIQFCRDVRAQGGIIRIDTRVQVGHIGEGKIHYPIKKQYQLHVYRKAAELLKGFEKPGVIDFGCGFGNKLVELIEPLSNDIIGLDKADCIANCKRAHSSSKVRWFVEDLETMNGKYGGADVAICADVVEHLDNTSNLLSSIGKSLTANGLAVISTPDVDTIPTTTEINPAHKQAWNESGFVNLLKDSGFEIVDLLKEKEIGGYISLYAICRR